MTVSNTRLNIRKIKKGQAITANYLNDIANAVNQNSKGVSGPKQRKQSDEVGEDTDLDLTFDSTSITNETVTITDSNGDTHDIERITQITFENSTGDVLTLNITY